MDRPGEKLKRVRERLKLTYREVEQASQRIAARRNSDEYIIALSRLADIENKGTVPTIYRFYTLCAIYRLEFEDVLGWYGVPRDQLASDMVQTGLEGTHLIPLGLRAPESTITQNSPDDIDVNKTTFLSHLIRRWGKLPFGFLNGMDLRRHRYGVIGLEDWSMYPVLHPGSLVLIDESRRKIAAGGWTNELERPIYFLEHREGFLCGWCTLMDRRILIHPHPASQQSPVIFEFQTEIDVLGQVVGVTMLLGSNRRRHART